MCHANFTSVPLQLSLELTYWLKTHARKLKGEFEMLGVAEDDDDTIAYYGTLFNASLGAFGEKYKLNVKKIS